jgi:hypothetical protein
VPQAVLYRGVQPLKPSVGRLFVIGDGEKKIKNKKNKGYDRIFLAVILYESILPTGSECNMTAVLQLTISLTIQMMSSTVSFSWCSAGSIMTFGCLEKLQKS